MEGVLVVHPMWKDHCPEIDFSQRDVGPNASLHVRCALNLDNLEIGVGRTIFEKSQFNSQDVPACNKGTSIGNRDIELVHACKEGVSSENFEHLSFDPLNGNNHSSSHEFSKDCLNHGDTVEVLEPLKFDGEGGYEDSMAGEVSSFNKDPDVCEEGSLHPRSLEDVRDMGLGTDVRDLYVEMVPSVENGSSCAARVDSLNNPKPLLKVCVIFI
ncbi:hypothetical protein V6N11_081521 [Hibiscus sabdariffa]|uniref:Uncharacterized protein n=2 Tax=Hibiscus sabdariffa TaxID=183260 RepID=A0ABR2AAE9_9ROSI